MGTHGDRYRRAVELRVCLVQIEDELDEWDSIELEVLLERLTRFSTEIVSELQIRARRRRP